MQKKPTLTEESDFSKFLKNYQVVDISQMGIYKYTFGADKDIHLSVITESNQNPIYNKKDSTVLYERHSKGGNWKISKIYRTSGGIRETLIFRDKPKNSRSPNFVSENSEQIAFIADASTIGSSILYLASYNAIKPIPTMSSTQPPGKTDPPILTKSTPKSTTNNSNHNQLVNSLLIFCFLFSFKQFIA